MSYQGLNEGKDPLSLSCFVLVGFVISPESYPLLFEPLSFLSSFVQEPFLPVQKLGTKALNVPGQFFGYNPARIQPILPFAHPPVFRLIARLPDQRVPG